MKHETCTDSPIFATLRGELYSSNFPSEQALEYALNDLLCVLAVFFGKTKVMEAERYEYLDLLIKNNFSNFQKQMERAAEQLDQWSNNSEQYTFGMISF